jgi:hypothetical protein
MRRDGRVLMRFETTGRKQVIRWVLSWMPDVKVFNRIKELHVRLLRVGYSCDARRE